MFLNGFQSSLRQAIRQVAKRQGNRKPARMPGRMVTTGERIAKAPPTPIKKARRSNIFQTVSDRPRARRIMYPFEWFARRDIEPAQLSGLGLVADGVIVPPVATGRGGTGASSIDSWASMLREAIPAYAQYQITKENIDLVKAGKKPLDTAQFAPTVRVVGETGQQTQNLIRIAMIGTGVLVGGLILSRAFAGRRRR